MLDEEVFWCLAFLVKLHRGDSVADASGVADKAVEAFKERCDVPADED